ncbi:hypothetical protein H7F15_13965 [Pontibacter sp. Tf4]|uniref:hypothetical protein n=1 Tax=Pontibacter sp. Tf4 TaxID=2761620 RepID=UPI001627AB04|nr:hypothetical protein [Pontibacter sp. Tf4]MBB6612151.1 hypothetical protein [Pontibacter sp. Tf4]
MLASFELSFSLVLKGTVCVFAIVYNYSSIVTDHEQVGAACPQKLQPREKQICPNQE